MITLLLVDDHPVVRNGPHGMFAAAPDFEVLGAAAGGAEAVAMAQRLDPDVVLMDPRMPEGGGVAAIRELTARGLRCRGLVLTTYDTDADVIPAIKAGATGYLREAAHRDELFEAVRAAAENRTVLSPAIAARLVEGIRAPVGHRPLSARELDVPALVARGTTNREIARTLFISEATVKTHLTHLYAKLEVTDRAAAVATAYERGIRTPRPPDR
ncbi:response regulator transcription factor [Actinokineospora auranticolor]|uniref:DNA-binding NarL/FixJ family response regulator n=1 Tax=Actinokineospora auranticolor TaxID=155976 RepID=A0A2S6GK71_9PSEU|nr:response regulator transcription factor [Actinokineospora auranticolor]PPK65632.1 DNA-binding NarL/FixJ family response regulator [Actinokineospora auranticolor]